MKTPTKRIAWARYRVLKTKAGEYPAFTNDGELNFRYFRFIGERDGEWVWAAYGWRPDDGEHYNLLKFDIRKCPQDAVPLAFHDIYFYSSNPVEYVKAKPEWVWVDVSRYFSRRTAKNA